MLLECLNVIKIIKLTNVFNDDFLKSPTAYQLTRPILKSIKSRKSRPISTHPGSRGKLI